MAKKIRFQPRGAAAWIVLTAWIAIVAAGTWLLWQYEHTAGLAHQSPDRWPAESQITPAADRFTLLHFAHPKCPCTRASIGELSRLMTDCKDQVDAHTLFVKPSQFAEQADWEKTDLWTTADQIPGVTAVCDHDGIEAVNFHAATSGFALLFDRTGQRRFQGGITASRGHSGDNMGRSAVVEIITRGSTDIGGTQVFGCALGTSFAEPSRSCCQQ